MEKIRKHMCIYGEVQGVGFRYRASQAARSLGVTGWVYNEFDGSVVMEVQGTQEQFDRMLVMISQGSWVTIDRVEEKELPVDEEEKNFRII